jgi:archaemetzincin
LKKVLLIFGLAVTAGLFMRDAPAAEKSRIIVVALEPVEPQLLDYLQSSLAETFKLPVVTKYLPQSLGYAYERTRRQYRSAAILRRLPNFRTSAGELILGIVNRDLYAPKLNFVFGEADIKNGVCVISLARLRQSFYGLPSDKALLRQRARKEAVHELGHLYGLKHCPDIECVMHFSNSLQDTDRKSADFCAACGSKIERR